jgi:hypothetical protein
MFRAKYLSVALLLFSGHVVIAQETRDPMQPTLVREPLTDTREAARLYYLTLANMPASDLTASLKKMGLSGSEITTVTSAAKSLKASHDANASAYQAQGMRQQNTDSDLAAYVQQQDTLLQQNLNNVSNNLSALSLTALSNAVSMKQSAMKLNKFYFEIPSPMPVSMKQRNTPRLTAASYHPKSSFLPHCPNGNVYQLYLVSGAVSESNTFSTSNGTSFSLTTVGNGTYTITFETAWTCVEPAGDVFHVQMNATFTSGAGNLIANGATQSDFCGHPGSGSFNLSSVTGTVNFTDPENVDGTLEVAVIDVKALQTSVLASIFDYIKGFYEHTATTGNNGACPGAACVAYEEMLCYPPQSTMQVTQIVVSDRRTPPSLLPAPQYDNWGIGFSVTGSAPWFFPPGLVVSTSSTNPTTVPCTVRN